MTMPSLATAAATSAICSGVACTSFWPIDAWARNGRVVGHDLGGPARRHRPRAGRAAVLVEAERLGAVAIMPDAWAFSTPISANAVLHESGG